MSLSIHKSFCYNKYHDGISKIIKCKLNQYVSFIYCILSIKIYYSSCLVSTRRLISSLSFSHSRPPTSSTVTPPLSHSTSFLQSSNEASLPSRSYPAHITPINSRCYYSIRDSSSYLIDRYTFTIWGIKKHQRIVLDELLTSLLSSSGIYSRWISWK